MKNNYSRKQIEAYLMACQGWERSELANKNTMELLELVNPQEMQDWFIEIEEEGIII